MREESPRDTEQPAEDPRRPPRLTVRTQPKCAIVSGERAKFYSGVDTLRCDGTVAGRRSRSSCYRFLPDGLMRTSIITALTAATIAAIVPLPRTATAQRATSIGRFDLSVEKSPVLRSRKNHLESTSASAIYSDPYMKSRMAGFKIEMPAGADGSAAFVVLLDKAGQITQVNLAIVVPGSTVIRTIAWTPADLAKYFSEYRYENHRLRLRSKGTYATGPDSPNEVLSMSWDVDLDVPVVENIK